MIDNLVVFENEQFIVKQCENVSIAGYLIITPKVEVFYFSDLSPDVLQLLTSLIAKLEKVLREVLKVEMIYIAKFAELTKYLHFHLFPRTESILLAYRRANPSAGDQISGPLIFEWSRKHFTSSVKRLRADKTIIEILSTIREKLKST